MSYVGTPYPRKEDARLLTGRGTFVADIKLPGMVEVAIFRSPVAHARIVRLNLDKARTASGVIGVFSSQDLEGKVEPFTRPFYKQIPEHVAAATELIARPYRADILASEKVFRVGEPVAVVVARDRYVAEDALESIEVDFELLPVVTDPLAAMANGAPELHDYVPGNIHSRFKVRAGDPVGALAHAQHTLAARFVIGRSVGSPLETRGVLAESDLSTGELRVWSTQPRPHLLRTYLSEMLHLPEGLIRVISPDMGGAFGGGIYNEEIITCFLAIELGRPVRWIEDRRENLGNARHSRDQSHEVEAGFDDDGIITVLRDTFVVDTGAYNPFVITLPYNTAAHIRSEFKIDNFEAEAISVLTNKRDNTPVRGAGRTSATFVSDRVVDMVASFLQADPADIRGRNLIPAEAMPYDMGMLYRDGGNIIYDSGDYPAQLAKALEAVDYQGFRTEQQEFWAEGRFVGIGLSCHVEGSGLGPYEGAMVRVDPSGHVFVHSGSNPHGQSHETVLAQVCADALGIPPAHITVRAGDTDLIPYGGGTFASRSAVTAGSAVQAAATRVRNKILAIAGEILEVDPGDLTIESGVVVAKGVPGVEMSLAEVASAATPGPAARLPAGMEPGLEETEYFVPQTVTYSSGTHVAIVEVDPDTGVVTVLRYLVVDDCGRILNPMVVDGQQHGGVAHGIGNALFEEILYDVNGQLLNASFMDYLLPTAAEVPFIEVLHQSHLSPLNPMGIKGVGEGAAVSPPGAIANAIVDALRPLGVEVAEIPITPEKLWRAIQEAKGSTASHA